MLSREGSEPGDSLEGNHQLDSFSGSFPHCLLRTSKIRAWMAPLDFPEVEEVRQLIVDEQLSPLVRASNEKSFSDRWFRSVVSDFGTEQRCFQNGPKK